MTMMSAISLPDKSLQKIGALLVVNPNLLKLFIPTFKAKSSAATSIIETNG
jgi:hypothetical protein